MADAQALIATAVARYLHDCRCAVARMHGARTLRDVARDMEIHTSPYIAAVVRSLPETRSLAAAAETAAERLCTSHVQQLQVLAKAGDTEGFDKLVHRFQVEEWTHLRGRLARVFVRVEREIARLRDAVSEGETARGPSYDEGEDERGSRKVRLHGDRLR